MDTGYHGARNVLLADDDDDDRLLFLDVLKELKIPVKMTSAPNGEVLMQMLAGDLIPDVLFLDLNMPLKNGFECLVEIRQNQRLDNMPVVIFSTSSQPSAIDRLHADGAQLYIRKPNDFTQLKNVVRDVLNINWKARSLKTAKQGFVFRAKSGH